MEDGSTGASGEAQAAADGSRRPITRAQLHVVAVLGFCGLVSAADNWFVSPALPAIARGLSVLPAAATVVLTAYMVPYGALQPVCGAIADRVGRLRLLRAIVLGLCAGTVLCAAAPSLELLVAARILTGCFAAGIISVSQAFVGDVVEPARRGGAVGMLMGITFTGQGLSAGLGGILTELVGWRVAFASFGILAAAAWILLSTLREPDGAGSRTSGGSGSVSAAGGGCSRTSGGSGGVSAAGGHGRADGTAGEARARAASGRRGTGAERPVVAFLAAAVRIFLGPHRAVFLLACSTGVLFLGVYGLMGTFLNAVCGLGSTEAGLVMMLYGVFCLVGGALSGRLGGRLGLPGVIAVGEASAVAAACALLASAATASWVPALVAAGCLGLGYILVQPTLVTLSMDADPERAGLCTGLIGSGVFIGGGVGSALGGLLLGAGGYLVLWGVAAAGLAVQLAASRRLLG
ncbi:MAG TPA: MFS transporter [Candidatus Collinsella stercoripullorum]|nr:MFS transporter [Candidatus Collinsella stercoripullorum]